MAYAPKPGDRIMVPAIVLKVDDKNNVLCECFGGRYSFSFLDLENFCSAIAKPGTETITAPAAHAWPDYASTMMSSHTGKAAWQDLMIAKGVSGWAL